MKFARRWAYTVKGVPDNKASVIFAKGNFWGRGLAACGASDDPARYGKFGPFNGLNFDMIEFNNVKALEERLASDPNTAAFMIEPIQGEKGKSTKSTQQQNNCPKHSQMEKGAELPFF